MNPPQAIGKPLHWATCANAVFLLLALQGAYEQFVVRYHSGGQLFELWLSLAVVGAITTLGVGCFQYPGQRRNLVINAGLLTLALVLFAGATVEEKRNRARSADVQQRLDEARQAKQLPVPP
jgi:hypothetical protein